MEAPLTVNLELHVAAERHSVWQALTDPAQLGEWLCAAEVDLNKGHFALYGDRLPDAPVESPTELVLAEEPVRLHFAWQLRGARTLVDISLEDCGEGCKVQVRHSGLMRRPEGKSGTTDFWVVALENLRLYCLGRAPVRYDFSEHGPQVELAVDVAAPREQLFGALLDPADLDEFWSSGAVIEPRVGGRYSYGWKNGGPTKILELVPDERLKLDWSYAGEPDTVVSWQLAGNSGRTRLTLVHTGFDPPVDREDYRHGWLGFLVPLEARAELGARWSRVVTDGYAVEDPG
jgi:uncharacterized protein YndB with AHSA1/START domain